MFKPLYEIIKHLDLFKEASILDACAAPGGKAIFLADKYPFKITALDINPIRRQRLLENVSHQS